MRDRRDLRGPARLHHCLKDCTESGTCAVGTCTALTSADCPTCDVVTKACLAT